MDTFTYALDTTWRILCKDLGVVAVNALRRAGLPEDLLQLPTVRLVPEEYYRLWHGVEAEHGDPLFPIRVCEAVRSESFSPPLFAAMCSPNLLVAARRVAKYKKLIAPMQMVVSENGDTVTIDFCWESGPLPPPVSLVTMELLFCVSLARMGTREAIRPIDVTTSTLPLPLVPYEDFFGARVLYGHRHQIRFTRVDAMRPFLTSNESLWAAFEPDLRQRLANLQESASITKRLRAVLHEAIPSGMITMEAVAKKLAMSKRTLQRRVEAEGASFQQILKETREALAYHYLENTTLPASEISFLLGYDEPNSFYRAFRSWTGKTPDTIRHAA